MARRRSRHVGGSGRRFGAALVLVALVAAGCGNSSSDSGSTAGETVTTAGSVGSSVVAIHGVPGVTDTEIRYAVIGTGTNNPLGTCVLDCYREGIDAYFAFRNSQGGIHGRKLVAFKVLDDQLSQNQVKALEVTSANDVFGDFNATMVANGWADLDKAGVPTYAWGINFPEATGRLAVFGSVGTVCGACTTRVDSYLAGLVKAKKVAALGYGVSQNSKLCAEGAGKSIDKYGAETGQEAVYVNDHLEFGLPNGIGPEVTAMKKAGVEFIVTCIDLNATKTLALELARQGMGDVPMVHPNTYNQKFVKDAGELFEGDFVVAGFRPFEATPTGGLKNYLAWMKKGHHELSELAMVGWINADLAYQGLKAAGPNFDRAKVIAATNKMTAYSADGLLNPIDWTRQHNPPTEEDSTTNGYKHDCAALVRVVHGEFKTVAPKDKPFLCWSNANRDWSEPVPTTFR